MAGKLHSFTSSVRMGNWVEDNLAQYMLNAPLVKSVENVSNDPFYRSVGVDLLVSFHTFPKSVLGYEVKGQGYPPEAVFLETLANDVKQTPGWVYTTASDTLVFYFLNDGVGFFISSSGLRAWATPENLSRFEKKVIRNGSRGKETYRTEGYVVPIKTLLTEQISSAWLWHDLPKKERAN